MGQKSENRRSVFKYLTLSLLIVSFTTITYHIAAGIVFDRDFKGYLKRAADANSVELASKELDKAIAYLKTRNLDTPEGRNLGWHNDHTSVVYTTPDEQISFFYDNLITCRNELRVVQTSPSATPTDRSNTLIKLRETLIDHAQDGDRITYPEGLDVYPYNGALAILIIVPMILSAITGLFWFVEAERLRG